jgi:hypothetical protein
MSAPPLTHHEILEIVEPFSRQGRHVDLAASDRIARKLVFKPIDHPGHIADAAPLRETLELESVNATNFRLTRLLTGTVAGREVKATLQARGADAAELLGRFARVELGHHFRTGPGYVIARSYQFESYTSGSAEAPVLSRGVVAVDGFTLTFDILAVRGAAADLTLQAGPGEHPQLPDDLLAVIGWDWVRLVPQPDRWTSRMRLRGTGRPRTETAERALEKAAVHLARVLAEPPQRFHERFVWARWGAVLRRLIPTLTAVGMVAGTLLLPRLATNVDPGFWLALHYVPIGILGVAFMLQELPRFEIPPLPRRLTQPSWRQPRPIVATEGSAWPATR